MWLVFLLYTLMASTFTAAKAAMYYMQPIYFIAFRMIVAGAILLLYVRFFKREHWRIRAQDCKLLAQIIFFHIFIAYVFEFWGLQFLSSAKACLLYNLSPFITALLCWTLFYQRLTYQQWIGLCVGFVAMIPTLLLPTLNENALPTVFISAAEIALLISVTAAAYGWIIVKELVTKRDYSPLMINGVGMLGGGTVALLTAFFAEGSNPLLPYSTISTSSALWHAFGCMLFLIIVANIIGYNLYGTLLKRYSATFLSFAGCTTPLFASIFGWIFLGETLNVSFFISLALTMLGLYLFYEHEMHARMQA